MPDYSTDLLAQYDIFLLKTRGMEGDEAPSGSMPTPPHNISDDDTISDDATISDEEGVETIPTVNTSSKEPDGEPPEIEHNNPPLPYPPTINPQDAQKKPLTFDEKRFINAQTQPLTDAEIRFQNALASPFTNATPSQTNFGEKVQSSPLMDASPEQMNLENAVPENDYFGIGPWIAALQGGSPPTTGYSANFGDPPMNRSLGWEIIPQHFEQEQQFGQDQNQINPQMEPLDLNFDGPSMNSSLDSQVIPEQFEQDQQFGQEQNPINPQMQPLDLNSSGPPMNSSLDSQVIPEQFEQDHQFGQDQNQINSQMELDLQPLNPVQTFLQQFRQDQSLINPQLQSPDSPQAVPQPSNSLSEPQLPQAHPLQNAPHQFGQDGSMDLPQPQQVYPSHNVPQTNNTSFGDRPNQSSQIRVRCQLQQGEHQAQYSLPPTPISLSKPSGSGNTTPGILNNSAPSAEGLNAMRRIMGDVAARQQLVRQYIARYHDQTGPRPSLPPSNLIISIAGRRGSRANLQVRLLYSDGRISEWIPASQLHPHVLNAGTPPGGSGSQN